MNNYPNRTPNQPNSPLENEQNLDTNIKTVNPEPVSYADGYVHGRTLERSLENQRQEVRDEHTAARGLLLGIALTSLVGLVVGSLFFLNQRQESPTPVLVPSPSTSQQPATNKETTIIERIQEVPVPASNTEPEVAPIQIQRQNPSVTTPRSGQQQAPTQQNTTPETAPAPAQKQTQPTSPSATQQNTTPQTAPAPTQEQPDTDTTTTQPNTTNQTSPTQTQNQIPTGTLTTPQQNTNTPTSPTQPQNQSQSTDSGSAE